MYTVVKDVVINGVSYKSGAPIAPENAKFLLEKGYIKEVKPKAKKKEVETSDDVQGEH
jgi:hypothetical protein